MHTSITEVKWSSVLTNVGMKRTADYDLEMVYRKPFRTSSAFNPWDQTGRNILARRAAAKRLAYNRAAPRSGFNRRAGYYGRFGANARNLGNIPENKFFDTTLGFTVDATGEVPATGQLNLIPQGDTESTRDGRQCSIDSIQIKATVYLDPAAGAGTSQACLMLVQDTQCNGAAAAAGDVMTGTNFSVNMINLANSKRFKIIKKWDMSFNPGAGVNGAIAPMIKYIKYYKKCNVPLEFSAATGALTEIKSNNLFLLASSVATDDVIVVNGTCRLRFRG